MVWRRDKSIAVARIQSSVYNMNIAELLVSFPGSYGIFGNNFFIVFIVDYNVFLYCIFSLREKKRKKP